MDYDYVDPSVLSDSNRVSRIPYTIHEKSYLYCVPVYSDMDIEQIIETASNHNEPTNMENWFW